jgi:hypothetical protein
MRCVRVLMVAGVAACTVVTALGNPHAASAAGCKARVEVTFADVGARDRQSLSRRESSEDRSFDRVVVRRCSGARGRPVVRRAGRPERIALPILTRGTTVADVSVSEDAVAWRTWARGRRGRVFVARINGGRLAAVRSIAVGPLAERDGLAGTLAVTPDAAAAWALPRRGGSSRLWSWEPGARPRALTAAVRGLHMEMIDDQRVRVWRRGGSGERVVELRAKPLGRCPRPVSPEPENGSYERPARDLGDWCVGLQHSYSDDTVSGSSSSSSTRYEVFLPADRRVLADFSTSSTSNQYQSERYALDGVWRSGPLLIVGRAFVLNGRREQHLTSVVDTGSGQSWNVSGAVVPASGDVPTEWSSATDPATGDRGPVERPARIGAVAQDGVVAWIADGRAYLRDAAGLRDVGAAPPGAEGGPVRVADGRLRWAGGPVEGVAVAPDAAAPTIDWFAPSAAR